VPVPTSAAVSIRCPICRKDTAVEIGYVLSVEPFGSERRFTIRAGSGDGVFHRCVMPVADGRGRAVAADGASPPTALRVIRAPTLAR
jgi:hypothetical protein